MHDTRADDAADLRAMGYQPELDRRMGGFSNFAISMSIICILAGGVTSFAVGYCAVGGAAVGLGWPLVTLFALAVAATMGQVASAFPTAGGLYHWASILGGRGWGWVTAWFNLVGLITVLAAINVGTVEFVAGFLGLTISANEKLAAFAFVTASQAFLNHRGIRATTILTDFSGWWILVIASALTIALIAYTPVFHFERLWTFANHSGTNEVYPVAASTAWMFALGLLLPAYTITGFDASAHVAEETVDASRHVPRAIVRAVLVSGVFGWVMLAAVVLAMPDPDAAAAAGFGAFVTGVGGALPERLAFALFAAIGVAQYLCGLATVTSASRMAFAFARDGGLPLSAVWRRVSATRQVPTAAIWMVASVSVLLVAFAPYPAIAAACAVMLYISYVLPTALGAWAFGRTWTRMGPWHLGRWYRPLCVVAVAGCGVLLFVGVQPPNEMAQVIVGGMAAVLFVAWFGIARRTFRGPPAELTKRAIARSEMP